MPKRATATEPDARRGTRAVLIPVTDLNPDSDFHDFFASIPIPIQFRVRSDSNLEPTPQVDLIPYTYIRTHCR